MAVATVYNIVVMKKSEKKTHRGKINKIKTRLDQLRLVSSQRGFTFGTIYKTKGKFRFVGLRLYGKKSDECSSKSVPALDRKKGEPLTVSAGTTIIGMSSATDPIRKDPLCGCWSRAIYTYTIHIYSNGLNGKRKDRGGRIKRFRDTMTVDRRGPFYGARLL